jgi:hypothetical protein
MLHIILDKCNIKISTASVFYWPEFLATDPEVRVPFLALPEFLRSSGYRTRSTHLREYNSGATCKKNIAAAV